MGWNDKERVKTFTLDAWPQKELLSPELPVWCYDRNYNKQWKDSEEACWKNLQISYIKQWSLLMLQIKKTNSISHLRKNYHIMQLQPC